MYLSDCEHVCTYEWPDGYGHGVTDVFRTSDERFENLPGYDWDPHYFDLGGDLAGLRMHYLDEGEGRPVILVHGEPTWAFLYRKMLPALAGTNRVVVPDFIGFGRSDKPTERDWYSYKKHVAELGALIDGLDLQDFSVVVQDWGGPVGLRAAFERSKRCRSLIILNTGIFKPGPRWPTPGFLAWRDFAERNPDLPVGFVIQGATTTDLSEEVIAGYEAPVPTPESKAGAAAFPLLVPLTEDDAGVPEMLETRAWVDRWEKPALVAFSDSDPIFSQSAGERMAERIPGAAPFVPIASAGHFLQEDKGEELGTVVSEFLKNN
jgi:haloalkane dehalogenase